MTSALKSVRELIQLTADFLAEKGIDSPRLCAERLLGDVLGLQRIELYLQHDRPVSGDELARFRDLVRRRAAGEPLQTLIGSTEFYSREFKVEEGVFIPRPETERLVERCLELLSPQGRSLAAPLALEIGCGTGVIAITLAAEMPALRVHVTDTSAAAIRLSELNARRVGTAARLTFHQGDLYAPLPAALAGEFDLLVSNPPYIRRGDLAGLPREVAEHDPAEALDGGVDGLDVYRRLIAGAPRWLRPGGWLALEIGHDQGEAVPDLCARAGFGNLEVRRDYNDLPRVVTGRRPEGTGGEPAADAP
jgi:release factor glutamine methyltransferase